MTRTVSSLVRTVLLVFISFQHSAAQTCINNLNQIADSEKNINTNKQRTYHLCPNTNYDMAHIDFHNKFVRGQKPISVQPNLRVVCGNDGRLRNDCVLRGGDLHIDATDLYGVRKRAANVYFEGITFADTERYMVWGNKPGKITFIDCEFKDNRKAIAPILLDYFDSGAGGQLEMIFLGCIFKNNRYAGNVANPSIMTVNGPENRLTVESSLFKDNNMMYNNTSKDSKSFLIESSGPITIIDNCFDDNKVGVSPVACYKSSYDGGNNVGIGSNGRKCQFLASFQTQRQYDSFSPACKNFEESASKACKFVHIHPSERPLPDSVVVVSPVAPPTRQPFSSPTWSTSRPDLSALLSKNQPLYSDQYVFIQSLNIQIKQTKNGNLVLCQGTSGTCQGTPLWESGYKGPSSDEYVTKCQGDGHLLTRNGKGQVVWRTKKSGSEADEYFVAVSTDLKEVSVYVGTPEYPTLKLWSEPTTWKISSPTKPPPLSPVVAPSLPPSQNEKEQYDNLHFLLNDRQALSSDKYVGIQSLDVQLKQMPDGNLVLCGGIDGNCRGDIWWESGYHGLPSGKYTTKCQDDGHFLTRDGAGKVIWRTKKVGVSRRPYFVAVTSDGSKILVLEGTIQKPGAPLWSAEISSQKSSGQPPVVGPPPVPTFGPTTIFPLMLDGDIFIGATDKRSDKARLVIERDGIIQILWNNQVIWRLQLPIDVGERFFVTLQRDGNWIFRSGTPTRKGTVLWKTESLGPGDDYFVGVDEKDKKVKVFRGTPTNIKKEQWSS